MMVPSYFSSKNDVHVDLLHFFSYLPMRDLSLFLLKNSLSNKMRRGIRSFCHGVGSTSTLEQHKAAADDFDDSFLTVPSLVGSCVAESDLSGTGGGTFMASSPALTLEQMILQLDLEEEAARKARHEEYLNCSNADAHRRMSCVNNSDHVLQSARDALNQYPRFSVDGRDAMYRASFSNYESSMTGVSGKSIGHRRSVCCTRGCRVRACANEGYEMDLERTLRMPAKVAGESVIWCKPNVVAKLMGLEVVPVPVRGRTSGRRKASAMLPSSRKQSLRRLGRQELEKERLLMALHECKSLAGSQRPYGAMSPIALGAVRGTMDWRFRQPR